MAEPPDPVKAVLDRSPLSNAQRAALWDVFYDSPDADSLASKMDLVSIPTQVKAQLWDLKESDQASAVPNESPSSVESPALGRFVSGAWEMLNPVEIAKGIGTLVTTDPRTTLGNIAEASGEQFRLGEQARKEGRYLEALGRTAAGMPIVGPLAAGIAEQAAEGDIAGAAGRTVGLLAGPKVYGAALRAPSAAVRGAQRAGRAVAGSRLEPVVQEAVEYGLKAGIPVDAATATGNPAIRGTQALVDRSIGGAPVAMRAEKARNAGLTREGQNLAGRAAPQAATPESAGIAIRDSLTKRVDDLKQEADTAYGQLRAIENAPANLKTVRVGTKTIDTGVLNPQGKPITRTVPVTEDVALPVDMRAAKQALRPVLDAITQRMPIAQQQASQGLKALENLVTGKDYVPASVADANLSAIKSIARQADSPALRNVSQGLAARVVRDLETAIQQAVAQAGPQATAALQAGRQAVRAKYTTAGVLKEIRTEPVQVFKQATWADDAGIDRLRRVAREAPGEIRKLGRAYLDDAMSTATAEGGFQGAQRLHANWEKLGPQTKALLFPDAGLRADLDKFFLLAKKMAENPNPSGTGNLVSLGAQGGALGISLVMLNPITAAQIVVPPAAASALLHNQRFVKWLVKGMQTPATKAATPMWENLKRAIAVSPVVGAMQPATSPSGR